MVTTAIKFSFDRRNPPQVVLMESFINLAPPRRGWFPIALRSLPLAIKDSWFKKKHLRKARTVRWWPSSCWGKVGMGAASPSLEGQGWVSSLFPFSSSFYKLTYSIFFFIFFKPVSNFTNNCFYFVYYQQCIKS
jgi:hypothetical protein